MTKITVTYIPSEEQGIIHTHDFKKWGVWFPDDLTRAILYITHKQLTK